MGDEWKQNEKDVRSQRSDLLREETKNKNQNHPADIHESYVIMNPQFFF